MTEHRPKVTNGHPLDAVKYLRCWVCREQVQADAVTDTTKGLAHRRCVYPDAAKGD